MIVNFFLFIDFKQGAFKHSKIRELYLTDCQIYEFESSDFMGLESSLELIDLSGNNFTELPDQAFQAYDFLRTLIFTENHIITFDPSKIIFLRIYPKITSWATSQNRMKNKFNPYLRIKYTFSFVLVRALDNVHLLKKNLSSEFHCSSEFQRLPILVIPS